MKKYFIILFLCLFFISYSYAGTIVINTGGSFGSAPCSCSEETFNTSATDYIYVMYDINNQEKCMEFIPSSSHCGITNVTAGFCENNAYEVDDYTFTLKIRADNSGQPQTGSTLSTGTFSGGDIGKCSGGVTDQKVTMSSFNLTATTPYWLCADHDNAYTNQSFVRMHFDTAAGSLEVWKERDADWVQELATETGPRMKFCTP